MKFVISPPDGLNFQTIAAQVFCINTVCIVVDDTGTVIPLSRTVVVELNVLFSIDVFDPSKIYSPSILRILLFE